MKLGMGHRGVLERSAFSLCLLVASQLFEGAASTPAKQEAGPSPPPPPDRRVAITVDDLPGAVPGSDKAMGNLRDLKRDNREVLHALAKHKAPAIGFVIEAKLQVSGERDARAGLLEEWIDAGMELGNHTYSHVHFNNTSLEQFEDETARGDVVTRALLTANGKTERYFRHPALSTGSTPEAKTAFEAFLKSHGYQIAPVTVENADYQFSDVLADALVHHDKSRAQDSKADYRKYTQAVFEGVEDASRKLFQREVPQILLIHDNEINAELLDTLLTDLERRGYRFISIDDALRDPAYGTSDEFVGNLGRCYLCWSHRLLAAGHQPDSGGARVQPPAWITAGFQEIRKAHRE
jgi:peptidoglycan/xylan/chitin deacetylase (PgdA/CDA1 family)